MKLDVDSLSDRMMEILQGEDDKQLSEFVVDNIPLLIEEVRELRNRVNFLEIEKSELESALEEERGPGP